MLSSIFDKSNSCSEYLKLYSEYIGSLLSQVDYDKLSAVVGLILETRENGGTVYIAGNGGSAATSSHAAQDLAEVTRKANTEVFKCISFCDNTAKLTALGNDFGYDHVFEIQAEELMTDKDVLIVISASGNSINLVNAVNKAHEKDASCVGFLGFDGGKLLDICDISVHIQTPPKEYGPVEDVHMIFCHMIVQYLMDSLKVK